MRTSLALFLIVATVGLAACEKSDKLPAEGVKGIPPGIAGQDAVDADRARITRPPPASSGYSSDPNNPNGAPGPSTGLGTSASRY